jgi:hypothetical protein
MNFNPTQEQIKSGIRWLVTAFGMGAAGWFAHSGYITQAQVMDIFNSPTFMTLAIAVVSGIFGLMNHTQTNAIKIVDTIAKDRASPVVGIVTANTAEGKALAAAIPGNTTVIANSAAATSVAQDNVPPLKEKVNVG